MKNAQNPGKRLLYRLHNILYALGTIFATTCNRQDNVPVKSKLQHPPLPGHLTALTFPGVGNLTTMHKGWGI